MVEQFDDTTPKPGDSEQIRLMKQMVVLSQERTALSRKRSELSADRSRMAADRSEMSAERTYLNAERTLSVWIRTGLALMVFGIAIDRFGLVLAGLQAQASHAVSHELSLATGAALVAFGTLMTMVTGARFLAYVRVYRRRHHFIPFHHGPFLAPFFALLASVFGVILLLMMLVFFG